MHEWMWEVLTGMVAGPCLRRVDGVCRAARAAAQPRVLWERARHVWVAWRAQTSRGRAAHAIIVKLGLDPVRASPRQMMIELGLNNVVAMEWFCDHFSDRTISWTPAERVTIQAEWGVTLRK
jgi:hypothetical protein